MSGIWLINKPFDVLDAAVYECIRGYIPCGGIVSGKIVEFKREQVTPSSVVYLICDQEDGDLGQVKIRKKSDEMSELEIKGPRRPVLRGPFGGLDALKKAQQRQKELYQKRKKLHRFIITAFWNRLNQEAKIADLASEGKEKKTNKPKRRGGAPRLEERDGWDSKVETVRRIDAQIERGREVGLACRYEGLPETTYRRWRRRLKELKERSTDNQ